jgi:hypothetical protein
MQNDLLRTSPLSGFAEVLGHGNLTTATGSARMLAVIEKNATADHVAWMGFTDSSPSSVQMCIQTVWVDRTTGRMGAMSPTALVVGLPGTSTKYYTVTALFDHSAPARANIAGWVDEQFPNGTTLSSVWAGALSAASGRVNISFEVPIYEQSSSLLAARTARLAKTAPRRSGGERLSYPLGGWLALADGGESLLLPDVLPNKLVRIDVASGNDFALDYGWANLTSEYLSALDSGTGELVILGSRAGSPDLFSAIRLDLGRKTVVDDAPVATLLPGWSIDGGTFFSADGKLLFFMSVEVDWTSGRTAMFAMVRSAKGEWRSMAMPLSNGWMYVAPLVDKPQARAFTASTRRED